MLKYKRVIYDKNQVGVPGVYDAAQDNEGYALYGMLNNHGDIEFLWVHSSGNTHYPEVGIALRPGWRLATKEDSEALGIGKPWEVEHHTSRESLY